VRRVDEPVINRPPRPLLPSAAGRFIQPDTIVPQPDNPQALNRYSYVLNNPLRHTDPTGHAPTAAVIPPGWFDLSKVQIDISNWPEMAKSLAVAGCFIVGCHVNRETNVISGPTQTEVLEAGMIGMVNPVGSETRLLANAGKRAIQEGGEQAAKQLAKQVGEAELQKIVQGATAAGKRVVVIGENMKDRVMPFAKSIGAEWYKPRSTIAENWMKNNMRWIQQQIKELDFEQTGSANTGLHRLVV